MPMYEYKCQKCGKVFEQIVKGAHVDVKCPDCGCLWMYRFFPTKTGFKLKGTGWHSTDYKKGKNEYS